jgi:predicted RNA binding protein YcfA (HicA-like mRNA interferase family)/predicted RNase H-like HicB family nuclease
VKVRDVIEMVEADGWYRVVIEGSHRQYKHPTKPGRVTICGHPRDEMPKGTLGSVMRQAGPEAKGEKMSKQYLVRIDKDADSDWGASVPDLPGCVATGRTLDSALRRIERALALHVRGLREDGVRVPPPRHRAITPRRVGHKVNFYATVQVAA